MVPEINRLWEHYTLAYKADQLKLIIGNAVRQMFIDQSQSTNRYVTVENANYDFMLKMKLLSQRLGVKTHYYLVSQKVDSLDALNDDTVAVKEQEEECLSCGS